MADKLHEFQQVDHQHDAGQVNPMDVQKYGMERATQIAIQKAEAKARFDSQPKPKTVTPTPIQN